MKILLLSFYFPPDLSACSFRMKALVEALQDRLPPGAAVDLLTSLPNRYGSFSPDAPEVEVLGNCVVQRFAVPAHSSGMMDQARAHASFVRQVFSHVRGRDYDAVFATSSRLMTASLGAAVARRKGIPLLLDIRDIFVETTADLLAGRAAGALVPLFGGLERWTIESATAVNLVSEGFAGYFERRYPHIDFRYITNGVDEEFVRSGPPSETAVEPASPTRIVYAGNLGEGQGLHRIVPHLAQALGSRAHFRLFGDGGRRAALIEEVQKRGLANVEIVPPVPRAGLIKAYDEADILFLHLNDHSAFERVLPSKIFEYAATGRPILAGVGGYAARFLREEVSNAQVFRPGDLSDAMKAMSNLSPGCSPRADFVARFGRSQLSAELAELLLGISGVAR